MNEIKNYEILKKLALNYGIKLFGVCEITKDMRKEFHPEILEISKNLKFGISLGYPLDKRVIKGIKDKPTLLYKHHYKTVNWILDQSSELLSLYIREQGFCAISIPASQVVDFEKQLGHLSHKMIAKKAGLGFIGRSGLLINPEYGPAVRYATILTDFPLKVDKEYEGDCGECMICADACPAGAITKDGYDRWKCYQKLKEFAGMRGIGVCICGICIKVCPYSKIEE